MVSRQEKRMYENGERGGWCVIRLRGLKVSMGFGCLEVTGYLNIKAVLLESGGGNGAEANLEWVNEWNGFRMADVACINTPFKQLGCESGAERLGSCWRKVWVKYGYISSLWCKWSSRGAATLQENDRKTQGDNCLRNQESIGSSKGLTLLDLSGQCHQCPSDQISWPVFNSPLIRYS